MNAPAVTGIEILDGPERGASLLESVPVPLPGNQRDQLPAAAGLRRTADSPHLGAPPGLGLADLLLQFGQPLRAGSAGLPVRAQQQGGRQGRQGQQAQDRALDENVLRAP